MTSATTPQPLMTVRDLQRWHFPNTPLHVVKYAIDVCKIEACQRVGIIRLFNESHVEQVRIALEATRQRRTFSRAAQSTPR